jgi:hypothetical protein
MDGCSDAKAYDVRTYHPVVHGSKKVCASSHELLVEVSVRYVPRVPRGRLLLRKLLRHLVHIAAESNGSPSVHRPSRIRSESVGGRKEDFLSAIKLYQNTSSSCLLIVEDRKRTTTSDDEDLIGCILPPPCSQRVCFLFSSTATTSCLRGVS